MMRRFINAVRSLFEGQALYEMATISPAQTGLSFGVFVSQKGGARHDVRVKVSSTGRSSNLDIVVSVRPEVKLLHGHLDRHDFADLRDWITLNRDTLIAYWDEDIPYTSDLMAALVPLP